MSTPRIDTLHRVIDSVIVRLDELWPDITDLHDLAHVRHKAAAQARVSGGDPMAVGIDLDTHGNPEARRLLNAISTDLVRLGREAENDLKAIRRYLNRDEGRVARRDRSADVTPFEFVSARAARRRRKARGEMAPHRIVSQPERRVPIDPIAELEALRVAVRKMVPRFEQEHADCRHRAEGDRPARRKTRRVDRALLSTAQRDAWDRALADDEEAAAS